MSFVSRSGSLSCDLSRPLQLMSHDTANFSGTGFTALKPLQD
jgi:hypothetical protein